MEKIIVGVITLFYFGAGAYLFPLLSNSKSDYPVFDAINVFILFMLGLALAVVGLKKDELVARSSGAASGLLRILGGVAVMLGAMYFFFTNPFFTHANLFLAVFGSIALALLYLSNGIYITCVSTVMKRRRMQPPEQVSVMDLFRNAIIVLLIALVLTAATAFIDYVDLAGIEPRLSVISIPVVNAQVSQFPIPDSGGYLELLKGFPFPTYVNKVDYAWGTGGLRVSRIGLFLNFLVYLILTLLGRFVWKKYRIVRRKTSGDSP